MTCIRSSIYRDARTHQLGAAGHADKSFTPSVHFAWRGGQLGAQSISQQSLTLAGNKHWRECVAPRSQSGKWGRFAFLGKFYSPRAECICPFAEKPSWHRCGRSESISGDTVGRNVQERAKREPISTLNVVRYNYLLWWWLNQFCRVEYLC
jgi:hypothetical protein